MTPSGQKQSGISPGADFGFILCYGCGNFRDGCRRARCIHATDAQELFAGGKQVILFALADGHGQLRRSLIPLAVFYHHGVDSGQFSRKQIGNLFIPLTIGCGNPQRIQRGFGPAGPADGCVENDGSETYLASAIVITSAAE